MTSRKTGDLFESMELQKAMIPGKLTDMTSQEEPHQNKKMDLDVYSSAGFPSFLASNNCSIAFTTYQAGRLMFLGVKESSKLWLHERIFERCQGLYTDGDVIWISSTYQLTRLKNMLSKGQKMENGCDANFVPASSHITSMIDTHDIGLGKDGKPIFVNTKFNCLSTISDVASFKPIWKPYFISDITPGDRCHMNGLAMDNGKPKYVTTISRSDIFDGWRDRRDSGGTIIDVEKNELLTDKLSMPHSPRLYNGKLYVLNTGTGEFGIVDKKNGKFEAICFTPGFARGLSFINDYAVIGLSLPRENRTFNGLKLNDTLNEKDTPARCGLIIVDLKTGNTVEWLRIGKTITELYDVAVMPGILQPRAVGTYKREEICNHFTIEN